ncbi:LysR substrate-binding domain-containing protein [Acidocella sp.]|uniref:LysR substrate-binding domain-containing protein n=1 Tax=Acidocella sp. TaxID=50710 RepID=UPI002627BE74|nr:LysR substrate-binding domain-containing protein [Acidocella sp.]
MGYAPLNALKVFDAVFRHGTFYGAAEELSVTPSAISHQMRHLEEWLGIGLFERRGKQLKFAAHAVSLAGALRLAFSDIDHACQDVRRKNKNQQLTVAVIPSVAICWLIPRLPLFREFEPKIDLKIIYAIFGHEINFEDVDIAIIYARDMPVMPKMHAIQILSGASVPVCSQSFVDSHPRLNDTDDVARCNLLHDTDTAGWRAWLGDAYPTKTGAAADIIFEDFNLLRAAVLAGQGVALCPPAIIQDDLETGRLVKLSDRTINDEYNYFAVCRESLDGGPVSIFFEWLSGATGSA